MAVQCTMSFACLSNSCVNDNNDVRWFDNGKNNYMMDPSFTPYHIIPSKVNKRAQVSEGQEKIP
jgi:hypothetical protein